MSEITSLQIGQKKIQVRKKVNYNYLNPFSQSFTTSTTTTSYEIPYDGLAVYEYYKGTAGGTIWVSINNTDVHRYSNYPSSCYFKFSTEVSKDDFIAFRSDGNNIFECNLTIYPYEN